MAHRAWEEREKTLSFPPSSLISLAVEPAVRRLPKHDRQATRLTGRLAPKKNDRQAPKKMTGRLRSRPAGCRTRGGVQLLSVACVLVAPVRNRRRVRMRSSPGGNGVETSDWKLLSPGGRGVTPGCSASPSLRGVGVLGCWGAFSFREFHAQT